MNSTRASIIAVIGASASVLAGPIPTALPIDPNLSAEARSLHAALQRMTAAPSIAFGQHMPDWASAVQPTGNVSISDWEAVTGTRPAFHEWDWIVILSGPQGSYSTNEAAVNLIRAEFQEGAIIGFCWHMPNPALEGQPGNDYRSHDSEPVVPRLLPGGDLHLRYIDDYLSAFGDALDALQVNGVRIPIIMRPYHEPGWLEMDGSGNAVDGFWWNWSTVDEYKALWRMTVEYLRDTRGFDNLLWAYSPNWPTSQAFYDARYQADYMDICGVDQYRSASDPNPDFATPLSFAITRGQADGKIVAYTEMGPSGLAQAGSAGHDFWFGRVHGQLAPTVADVAYALTWANWSASQYYVPPPSAPQAARQDFIGFLAASELSTLAETVATVGDLYSGPARCSAADLAEPFGVLDFYDVAAYLSLVDEGCTGGGNSPLDVGDLHQLDQAWLGTVNSNTLDGDGVIVSVTADGSGFIAMQATVPLDLSAAAVFGLQVEDLGGAFDSAVLFVQSGSGWTWQEGDLTQLPMAVPAAVTLDPAIIVNRNDVRGWGIQAYGATPGRTASLRITPYTVPVECGPADIAAPFGQLDAADVSEYLTRHARGCP